MNARFTWLNFAFSIALCSLLTLIPMAGPLTQFYPNFLLLISIAWSWAHPERFGVFFGLSMGLMSDLLYGTLLGRMGLSFALVMYLISMGERYFAHFATAHRAIMVVILVAVAEIVAGILFLTQSGYDGLGRWWFTQALGSGLCWPLVQWLVIKSDRFKVMANG